MSKHALLMLACCLIPLALIVALPATGLDLGSAAPLLMLLCPLMHILMMVAIGHDCRKDGNDGAGDATARDTGRPCCPPKAAAAAEVGSPPR